MNLGMGVLINRLFGSDRGGKFIEAAKGKQIAGLALVTEHGDSGHDGLVIRFDDGTGIELYDDGQSCCENRYMHTDDDLVAFVGATFMGAEEREAPGVPDEYGAHEVGFLVVATTLGAFTVETHNVHNGYYGGFYLKAISA